MSQNRPVAESALYILLPQCHITANYGQNSVSNYFTFHGHGDFVRRTSTGVLPWPSFGYFRVLSSDLTFDPRSKISQIQPVTATGSASHSVNTRQRLWTVVSGAKGTFRVCANRFLIDWSSGCRMESLLGVSGEICVCQTDRCNMAAAMTSSLGHVIVVVVALIFVVLFTARLM